MKIFPKTKREWNYLPQQIVDANSLYLAILGKIEHLLYRAAKFIDCKCMLVIAAWERPHPQGTIS